MAIRNKKNDLDSKKKKNLICYNRKKYSNFAGV